MCWTASGDKICIAYDDGAVIVGSVDGNRLWGKDLNLQLSMLQWSPDGAYIVFATASGDCHTYDSSGNAVAKVQLFCNEGYNGEQGIVHSAPAACLADAIELAVAVQAVVAVRATPRQLLDTP
jgi:WD repeat-containing protein 35